MALCLAICVRVWIILNYKQYMDIRCKSDNKLGKNLDQRGEEFNTSEKIQKIICWEDIQNKKFWNMHTIK